MCRLPNLRNFFMSVPRCSRKFAPGWTSGPLMMSLRMSSMFHLLTRSGYVSIMATWRGTATWSIRKFGSGEMTVRPLKSTRLPLKLPRNRPCLPLRRWQKPRVNFFGYFENKFICNFCLCWMIEKKFLLPAYLKVCRLVHCWCRERSEVEESPSPRWSFECVRFAFCVWELCDWEKQFRSTWWWDHLQFFSKNQ